MKNQIKKIKGCFGYCIYKNYIYKSLKYIKSQVNTLNIIKSIKDMETNYIRHIIICK